MNDRHTDLHSTFQWLIPTHFNIATVCLHQWANHPHQGRRPALHIESSPAQGDTWSFIRLAQTSNRLANGLQKIGVAPGDRIAIAMGQRPETVAAYMAIFGLGGIAVPLPAAFGPELKSECLQQAGCRVAITDTASGPELLKIQAQYSKLTHVIGLGFQHDTILPWRTLLARQTDAFTPISTSSHAPALLLYQSNSSHPALGAVLPHRALIGNLPGFVASQNWFPHDTDTFWTSADWCSLHGLLNAILPCLYFGRPIVATLGSPDLQQALQILHKHQVSNAFFEHSLIGNTPNFSQLQMPASATSLRAVAIPGEILDTPLFEWCETHLGIQPNAVTGQTEINQYLAGSQQWGSSAGNLGRVIPGHRVAILDSALKPCAPGEVGQLAVHRTDITNYPDPALFSGYWANPEASQACFAGNWFLTGRFGTIDAQGLVRLAPATYS